MKIQDLLQKNSILTDIQGSSKDEVLTKEQKERSKTVLIITHYKRILEYLKPDYVHSLSQGAIWASDDHTLADTIDEKGYDGLLI